MSPDPLDDSCVANAADPLDDGCGANAADDSELVAVLPVGCIANISRAVLHRTQDTESEDDAGSGIPFVLPAALETRDPMVAAACCFPKNGDQLILCRL